MIVTVVASEESSGGTSPKEEVSKTYAQKQFSELERREICMKRSPKLVLRRVALRKKSVRKKSTKAEKNLKKTVTFAKATN